MLEARQHEPTHNIKPKYPVLVPLQTYPPLSSYMLRHNGLLRRTFAEFVSARPLRCAKRRRLANTFQRSRSVASSVHPPYFFANASWNALKMNITSPPCISRNNDIQSRPATPLPSSLPFPHRDLSLYKPVPALSFRRLIKIYGQLSKSRLTFLVLLTAMSGVALSPLSTTVPVLLSTALGTALCAASANAFNQLSEVPFDAQMARTRMRPLVRGAISSSHAAGFALATGIAGPAILMTFVNPTSAFLGAANIGLYAGIYTRLKRSNVVNTWVGAIVGGIPPLIGWTACGGKLLPSATKSIELYPPAFLSDLVTAVPMEHADNPLSALVLFWLLFSWQFPHFNSLSYMVRDAYAQGGYKMLSVSDPSHNTLVSLRHAAALLAICSVLAPVSGLTTWTFAMTSLAPNGIMLRAAWHFWRKGTEREAKSLFNISLWYLPVVLALMMVHKQGVDWLDVSWNISSPTSAHANEAE